MILSVITICWNDLDGLQTTYASLKKQVSFDFEWIVIDGDSSDGTKEWLKEYYCFSGIWVSEKDKGIYDAMQKGLSLAKGDYVIFMNSGDAFADANVIAEVIPVLGVDKPGLLYGDAWDVDANGNKSFRPARTVSHLKYGMIAHHQAMFFKRDILLGCPFTEFKLSGDYAMICWFAKLKAPILYKSITVCDFLTGGAHDIHRLAAMKEDLYIRREILKLSAAQGYVLYVLHWVHFLLKRSFPYIMRKLRSK